MAILVVPPLDEKPWPTLGPELCDWYEANLVYGPGPKMGERYVVEPEFRAEIYRMYEVYPRGHARAGRRRFKQVVLSKRKGTAKTEKAAIIIAGESHPHAPVRCDGFRRQGSFWAPVGRGVPVDPYIPMVAYTEEQAEDLAYGVLRQILELSEIADWYDIGLDRILVLNDHGRAAGEVKPLAGSPSARDGARTSCQHFDEIQRMYRPRLKRAHTTMVQNTFKLFDADAWTLGTGTAGQLGQKSIGEDMHEYAELVSLGKVADPSLFYAHRFAPEAMKTDTPAQVRAALLEATGPATWSSDVEALVTHYFEPNTDQAYFSQVWWNRWGRGGQSAFDAARFKKLGRLKRIAPGRLVTLGFDGARRRDATGLVATDVLSGFQQVLGAWERPNDADEDWEVDASAVDAAVELAFSTWSVWRLYADPPYWDEWVDAWAGRYGDERVVKWWTNRQRATAGALRVYRDAMTSGSLTHDGNKLYVEHIGNAYRKDLPYRNDLDEPLWLIEKERPDSPKKIDLAMAGCLSWEARGDAIAADAKPPAPKKSKVLHRRS